MQIHTAMTQVPPKNQHIYPTFIIRIISPELRISTPPPLAGGNVQVLSLSVLTQFPTHGLLSNIQKKNPHTFTILSTVPDIYNYIHASLLRPWLPSLHSNEKFTKRKALWYLIVSNTKSQTNYISISIFQWTDLLQPVETVVSAT